MPDKRPAHPLAPPSPHATCRKPCRVRHGPGRARHSAGWTLVGTVLCISLHGPSRAAGPHLTVYGSIDTGVARTRVSGTAHKTLLNGGQTDSLWGLRAREAIGPTSYALFALESGILPAQGTLADPERTFNQQAWLGLGHHSLGELRLGRQSTAGQAFVSAIEIAAWQDFGMGALMRAADNYQIPRQISWRSPHWRGWAAGISYSPNMAAHTQDGPRTPLYSLALRYAGGAGLLAASLEQSGRVPMPERGSTRRPRAWQWGASYDARLARVAGGGSQMRNGFVSLNGEDGPPGLQARGLQGLGPAEFIAGGRLNVRYFGLAVPAGQGELLLQWSQARPRWHWLAGNTPARTIRVMSLGYTRPLCARTSLYAFRATGRRYAIDTAVSPANPHSSRMAVGVAHHF